MNQILLLVTLFSSPSLISTRLIIQKPSKSGDVTHLDMIQNEDGDGKCVMSGVCGEVSPTLGYTPCSQETDHHKFVDDDSHMISVLRDECPELFSTDDPDEMPQVCCTAQELREMQSRIKYFMTFFGGCDSCLSHAKQIICHLGCAPNQNQFLKVTESEVVTDSSVLHKVSDVQYFVSESFLTATFERCKNLPKMREQLNKTECAGDMDRCTPQLMVDVWGMRGENIPYQLNIVMSDDPVVDGQDGRTFIPAPLMIRDMCSTPDCDRNC